MKAPLLTFVFVLLALSSPLFAERDLIEVYQPTTTKEGESDQSPGSSKSASEPLLVREWKVPADFMKRLLDGPPNQVADPNDPFSHPDADSFYMPLLEMLKRVYGIQFPLGASATFSPSRGVLTVENTEERLLLVDKLIRSLGPMEMFVLDEDLFRPLGSLVLNGGSFPDELNKYQWHVAPELMDSLLAEIDSRNVEQDPFAENAAEPKPVQKPARERPLVELLARGGIMAMPSGASVKYDREIGTLTCVNTSGNAFALEINFLLTAVSMSRQEEAEKASAPSP